MGGGIQMKLNMIMLLNTIIAGVYGVAFVLVPAQVLSLYGVSEGDAVEFMSQLFGAALIAFAALTWLARDAAASDARDAIVLALFIGFTIGLVVAVMGALAGFMNQLGWLTVVIYLFFSCAFGYFKFISKT